MSRVVGFDIFDTVLTRRVSPPAAVFGELGRQLSQRPLMTVEPEAFARERRRAEQRAMAHRGHATNIHDIYRELTDALMLDPEAGPALAREEFELEKRLTYPIASMVERVEAARQAGQRVVFVSDMYYPAAMLRELLEHHGVFKPEDGLYVSCDWAADKRSSVLFGLVMKEEGLSPRDWEFHGNHWFADIQGAKPHRIPATIHRQANPNRYEQILEAAGTQTQGYASVLAAASRSARLHVPVDGAEQAALRDVAAGVAGPLLVSSAIWILRSAQQLGLKRLYFLARDGQVLYDIARRLVDKWGLEIDCRYLYCSRQVWCRGFDDASVNHWIWSSMGDSTTLCHVLDRIAVDSPEVRSDLDALGYGESRMDAYLSHEDVVKLSEYFNGEQFSARAADQRQAHLDLMRDYLQQEGLFDGVSQGLVDTGWTGTLHETLSLLMHAEGRDPVHGFFIGLNPKRTDWYRYRHGYMFDRSRGVGQVGKLNRLDLVMMCEVFCAADHGTVCEYERTDAQIVPTLGEGWSERMMNWGLPLFRQAIDAVVDAMPQTMPEGAEVMAARPALDELLELFWNRPTRTEAYAWGRFPWDAGQGSEVDDVYELARPFKPKDFLRRTLKRRKPTVNHNLSWIEGSLWVTPAYLRWAIHGTNRVLDRVWPYYLKVKRKLKGGETPSDTSTAAFSLPVTETAADETATPSSGPVIA